jgi:hypothetical protein
VAPKPSIASTAAIARPISEDSSAATMSGIASTSAVTTPQVQTSPRRDPTYPQLIIRAIKESANGRLKVSELYRILPVYLPTIISKLNPSKPGKDGKWKTREEVFQGNVRQNLSRYKLLFRNIKHNETGKSTRYWELIVKCESSLLN